MSDEKKRGQAVCGMMPPDVARAVKEETENRALKENMDRIAHKIVVLSGKGGVGKSTVAVNLAASLAAKKLRTGLLDIDIHGPSVPKLLGMESAKLSGSKDGMIVPVQYSEHLKVISVGFMLAEKDDAVIWRGPLKYGIIKQFLKDVLWGDLDYLVIDSPPGTGDEPLSVCQLIENPDGAVIVTTPQDVALIDVRKSITFCRQVNMPVIGVVENMSGFICPHCGTQTDIFKTGGGGEMADNMGVPFLGNIPIERLIADSGDSGIPFNNREEYNSSAAQKQFTSIVDTILKEVAS